MTDARMTVCKLLSFIAHPIAAVGVGPHVYAGTGAYYTSVRLVSRRTVRNETGNDEGLKKRPPDTSGGRRCVRKQSLPDTHSIPNYPFFERRRSHAIPRKKAPKRAA